jgi:hypothetical protein
MMDLYSLTAATTARKVAEARAARKAYEKWTTRAAQVVVLLEDAVQAATNAAAAAPHRMASATPQRQTAETAPGDAKFRAGPLPHPSAAVPATAQVAAPVVAPASAPVTGSAPAVTTKAAAAGRIRAAAAAGEKKGRAFLQKDLGSESTTAPFFNTNDVIYVKGLISRF